MGRGAADRTHWWWRSRPGGPASSPSTTRPGQSRARSAPYCHDHWPHLSDNVLQIQVQVSQENLLDVAGPSGGHHTRSASVGSSHSNNLLQVKPVISLFKISEITMFSRTPRTSWWRGTGGTGQTSRIPGQPWAAGRATPPPTTAETAASGTGTATGKGLGVVYHYYTLVIL